MSKLSTGFCSILSSHRYYYAANGLTWDRRDANTLHFFRRTTEFAAAANLLAVLALLPLAGCGGGKTPHEVALAGCDGQLEGRIYGGIEADIDWQAPALDCAGMPRPDQRGARLRFAGTATVGDRQRHLLFILAMPTLTPGTTGTDLPTTITVIEEDAGRFFSNRDNPVCWTDVESQEKLRAPQDFRISGVSYCVAPLAELNGNGSLSFADLTFTGQLSWAKPE